MTSLALLLASVETREPAERAPTRETAARPVDLLLAHEPQVRRLVHRLLGWTRSAHDVEDVVQDVLLAAWAKRGAFRGEAHIATWLCSIAVRKAKNHARWAAVRRRWLAVLGRDEVTVLAPEAPCRLEQSDDLAAVRHAMAALPHADREILVLRYLEARPVEQVCVLLGIGRAAADARLSRARKRLRARLGLGPEAEDRT